MNMLFEDAANTIVIVRINQNWFEKVADLYFSKLAAHIQWILWVLVILLVILTVVQWNVSIANGTLCRKRMKISLANWLKLKKRLLSPLNLINNCLFKSIRNKNASFFRKSLTYKERKKSSGMNRFYLISDIDWWYLILNKCKIWPKCLTWVFSGPHMHLIMLRTFFRINLARRSSRSFKIGWVHELKVFRFRQYDLFHVVNMILED